MGAKRYVSRPVVIEAIQFTGENALEIQVWEGKGGIGETWGGSHLLIPTDEGVMRASVGDFIIKGTRGEFYPCKPGVFATKYEEVKGEGVLKS